MKKDGIFLNELFVIYVSYIKYEWLSFEKFCFDENLCYFNKL